MPNPLEVTLHASGAETSSGSGTPVEVGARQALDAILTVTAADGLAVSIESGPSSSGPWTAAGEFETVAEGQRKLVVCPVGPWVRVVWDTAAPATFEVKATAHQVYVTPEDLAAMSLPEAATADMDPQIIARACIDVSNEADGYLRRRYSMPLTSGGSELTRKLAHILAYEVLRRRGFQPEGPDELVVVEKNESIKWLAKVGAGTVSPGIVDSTPLRSGSQARVANRSSSSVGSTCRGDGFWNRSTGD
jgi:phage gp36-like protein